MDAITHNPCHQTGSTMIEVLVALLILAIGLLGMAGLQTLSLRNAHDAYLRTQATILAVDMVERMRAGNGSMAQGNDLAEWQQAVMESLPAGQGTLCIDAMPDDGTPTAPACDGMGPLHAVKLWWDADRDGQAEQRLAIGFRF